MHLRTKISEERLYLSHTQSLNETLIMLILINGEPRRPSTAQMPLLLALLMASCSTGVPLRSLPKSSCIFEDHWPTQVQVAEDPSIEASPK